MGAEKLLAKCRGYAFCYLAFEIKGTESETMLTAKLAYGPNNISVPVYPLDGDCISPTPRWVVVLPHVDAEEQAVTVFNRESGEEFFTYCFRYVDLKWGSRVAYKTKKRFTAKMRDIEKAYENQSVVFRVVGVYRASEEEDIVRIEMVFPYADRIDDIAFDEILVGHPEAKPIVMEDGLGNDGNRHVCLSYRLPHNSPERFIFSQTSVKKDFHPGIYSLSPQERDDYLGWHIADAASALDDSRYTCWLNRQRATLFELDSQRCGAQMPSIDALIVVDTYDGEQLINCMTALCAQTVPVETVFFTGHAAKKAQKQVQGSIAISFEEIPCKLKAPYTIIMNAGDVLEPDAIFELFSCLEASATSRMAYPDDDMFEKRTGTFRAPRLKPDINPDLLFAHNYIGTCVLVRTETFRQIDLVKQSFAGNVVYRLAVNLSFEADAVAHVARILNHRQKDDFFDMDAEPDIVKTFLHDHDIDAHVERVGMFNEVAYTVVQPEPMVSIVIPTKDHADLLNACVSSILSKADYENFEIVLVENNSTDPKTFLLYEELSCQDERVRVVTFEGGFNYSKIINFGASQARGELLLLLNNDTEAISSGFLRTMVGYFSRMDIGVLGALLRYKDGLVQNAGVALMLDGRLGFVNQNSMPELHEGYLGSLACPYGYSALLGACQMVRHSVFDQVGGYSEELGVTYNDIDFCWRVVSGGLRCVYTPYVQLYHREFASRGRDYVSKERSIQTEREAGTMRLRWPEYFAFGDPVFNPACDAKSPYFKLRW